jgi:hypothetical protein
VQSFSTLSLAPLQYKRATVSCRDEFEGSRDSEIVWGLKSMLEALFCERNMIAEDRFFKELKGNTLSVFAEKVLL